MNKKQINEWTETYNRFAEDSAYFASLGWMDCRDILNRLHRYETTLHTISEKWCNDEMSIKEELRISRKEENTEKKVREIAEKLGFSVSFNGDPRGGAIRFVLPSGRSNNWDGTTWGIYW